MTDKELFERHCEQISVFNNRNEECTCALLTETQFLSALKERDEKRVCANCDRKDYLYKNEARLLKCGYSDCVFDADRIKSFYCAEGLWKDSRPHT
jgi:hypothetical protein